MKKRWIFALHLTLVYSLAFADNALAGKRVLHINSYHEGVAGSDASTAAIREELANAGIVIQTFYMDTKRIDSETHAKSAALLAKAEIERFKPDLVIACDDAASKYLIQPYYRNARLPFVFCGVNWDASVYGFPYSNVTGVKEMEFVPQMLKLVKRYAKGERIGFLAADTLPERKNISYHGKIFGIKYTTGAFVKNFEAWKRKYIELQQQVDVLVLLSFNGIDGWNDAAAQKHVANNSRIPSGAVVPWVAPYVLISLAQQPEEQGTRAARMAKLILSGTRPVDIPIEENTDGKLFINLPVAKSMGVTFDSNLLKKAEILR